MATLSGVDWPFNLTWPASLCASTKGVTWLQADKNKKEIKKKIKFFICLNVPHVEGKEFQSRFLSKHPKWPSSDGVWPLNHRLLFQ